MRALIWSRPAIPIAVALLVVACSATAPPASPSLTTPNATAPAATTARATLPPIASPTRSTTSLPTPDAAVAGGAPNTPAATSAGSVIDGVYDTRFTKSDLATSPLLADADEVNDGNWGDWTLVLDRGDVEYTQHNSVESSAAAGKFSVAGDAVTLAFDAGANAGETFAFRWQLSDDVLTFRRDGSLNLPGPTPFLVTTWARRTATSVTPLADGGTMFPGTYSTRFAPGMTITIGDEVDLDCFPGYRCRGDIDVNLPFWVEFEFGSEHGSDVSIVRMDKIYADKARVRLVDPPNDLARWITSYPGLAVVDGPKQVTVGRLPATQVDVEASKETPFGPTGLTGADDPQWFGAGAGETVRFILLNVGSHAVLIKAGTGFENVTGDFQAAVDGVQPVIDSIVWDDE